MHSDDVLAILNAKQFLPFDVELPNTVTFRATDAAGAAMSASRESLLLTEPSGARHTIALRRISRISTDPLPGKG